MSGPLTAREVEVLLTGVGLGSGEHCDGDGAEPAYGAEPLDEFASEAGREVEP